MLGKNPKAKKNGSWGILMDIPGVVSAVRLSVEFIWGGAEASDATIFSQPFRVQERAPPPQWIRSLWYPLFPSFQATRRRHLVPLRPGEWGSGLLTEVIDPQRDPRLQLQLIRLSSTSSVLSPSSLAAAVSWASPMNS